MPITPQDIDALPVFTSAQLLKLTEHAIAQITIGAQAFTADGRQLTRADLGKLYDQRDRLREEVSADVAGETGSGNVLVRLVSER